MLTSCAIHTYIQRHMQYFLWLKFVCYHNAFCLFWFYFFFLFAFWYDYSNNSVADWMTNSQFSMFHGLWNWYGCHYSLSAFVFLFRCSHFVRYISVYHSWWSSQIIVPQFYVPKTLTVCDAKFENYYHLTVLLSPSIFLLRIQCSERKHNLKIKSTSDGFNETCPPHIHPPSLKIVILFTVWLRITHGWNAENDYTHNDPTLFQNSLNIVNTSNCQALSTLLVFGVFFLF